MSEIPVFVEGGNEAQGNNRKLFLFTGGTQVKVVSGTATSAASISSPPADWSSSFPNCGAIHEGRLWGALEHRVYYSLATDHEDLTSAGAGSISIFPGVGAEIKAITSFKGVLIVWKAPQGIYYVDTSDVSTTNWRVVELSKKLGIAGPGAFSLIENDIVFMSSYGQIFRISAVDTFGNLGVSPESNIDEFDIIMQDEFNLSDLGKTKSIFYINRNEVWFTLPNKGQSTYNKRLMMNLSGASTRFSISDRDVCSALFLFKNNQGIDKPYIGDSNGSIWELDTENPAKGTDGYIGLCRTIDTDFSQFQSDAGPRRKNFKFLELETFTEGNWPITVRTFIDNDYYETIIFDFNIGGAILGDTFILGQAVLGAGAIRSNTMRMNGSGRTLSLEVSNSTHNQGMELIRMRVYYSLGTSEN